MIANFGGRETKMALDYPGRYYVHYYLRYFNDLWDSITPMQYGSLLIIIAICGYVLMKTSR